MKKCTIYFILLFMSFCSFGQRLKNQITNDSFCVNIDLKEYRIDSCLMNMLSNIVNSDSAHTRFPPSLYYYDFTFANYINYRQLMITPARWSHKVQSYYKGIFNIGGIYFLCAGDINTDSFFTLTGKDITAKIKSYDSPKYDTLDSATKWFDWEHSPSAIIGIYRYCKGVPIHMYINIGKKIENIETKYPTQSP